MHIPLSQPDILGEEAYAAGTADRLTVIRLEETLARRCGRRHAVACASGAVAAWAGLAGMEVAAGDEVICSPLVPGGTLAALVALGVKPVFVDIDPKMLVVDPAAVEAAVTARSRAVIAAVGAAGQAGVEAVAKVARRLELPLLEDGGQGFGSAFDGRPLGHIGRASVFDFGPEAAFTTLGGGVLLTDDDRLAEQARRALAQPEAAGHFLFGTPMNPIAAGLGLAQVPRLDGILHARRRLAEHYLSLLLDLSDLILPDVRVGDTHAWPVFWVRLSPEWPGHHRDRLIAALGRHGIQADAAMRCAHRLPVCVQRFGPAPPLPVAESIAQRTLRLPFFNRMNEAQADQVCHSLTQEMLNVRGEWGDWPEGMDLRNR